MLTSYESQLTEALVAAGLAEPERRRLLFRNLEQLEAGLPRRQSPRDQLVSDLRFLTRQGSAAFLVWSENVRLLVPHQEELHQLLTHVAVVVDDSGPSSKDTAMPPALAGYLAAVSRFALSHPSLPGRAWIKGPVELSVREFRHRDYPWAKDKNRDEHTRARLPLSPASDVTKLSDITKDEGIALLVGEAGAGKSSSLSYLAHRAARTALARAAAPQIPVMVSAASCLEQAGSVHERLAEAACHRLVLSDSLPSNALMLWSHQLCASWLVLVDGFDELGDTSKRRSASWWLSSLFEMPPRSQLVIACRPHNLSYFDQSIREDSEDKVAVHAIESPDGVQLALLAEAFCGQEAGLELMESLHKAGPSLEFSRLSPMDFGHLASEFISSGAIDATVLARQGARVVEAGISRAIEVGDLQNLPADGPGGRHLLLSWLGYVAYRHKEEGGQLFVDSALPELTAVIESDGFPISLARAFARALLQDMESATRLMKVVSGSIQFCHASYRDYLAAYRIVRCSHSPEDAQIELARWLLNPDWDKVLESARHLWTARRPLFDMSPLVREDIFRSVSLILFRLSGRRGCGDAMAFSPEDLLESESKYIAQSAFAALHSRDATQACRAALDLILSSHRTSTRRHMMALVHGASTDTEEQVMFWCLVLRATSEPDDASVAWERLLDLTEGVIPDTLADHCGELPWASQRALGSFFGEHLSPGRVLGILDDASVPHYVKLGLIERAGTNGKLSDHLVDIVMGNSVHIDLRLVALEALNWGSDAPVPPELRAPWEERLEELDEQAYRDDMEDYRATESLRRQYHTDDAWRAAEWGILDLRRVVSIWHHVDEGGDIAFQDSLNAYLTHTEPSRTLEQLAEYFGALHQEGPESVHGHWCLDHGWVIGTLTDVAYEVSTSMGVRILLDGTIAPILEA